MNFIGRKKAVELATYLACLTSLQYLSLANKDMRATAMVSHLDTLTALQYLDLSMNNICINSVPTLASILSSLSSLTYLSLGGNLVGVEGSKDLAPHLSNLVSLQHLDLSLSDMYRCTERQLGPEIVALYEDFQVHSGDSSAATCLAPHLSNLTNLQHLNVSSDCMGWQAVFPTLGPQLATHVSL